LRIEEFENVLSPRLQHADDIGRSPFGTQAAPA
jgi:hypothetical protein